MSSAAALSIAADAQSPVAELMARARTAQAAFANVDQARADEAVRALAWSLYKPERAKELAELAVEDTGLGNVADKIIKKQRKTFGTLRDLLRAKSVGEIERDDKRGLVKFAKPIGVVGAVTPSTNPGATPVNKAMMAIKGRNAIIIAPSPLGYRTTEKAVDYMRAELKRIGLPEDLVQIIPTPVTKEVDAGADERGRPRGRHGIAGQRPPRLFERDAGDRRRGRQRAGDHRRDRRPRRRGPQDLRVEDLRQRDIVLVGERRRDRRRGL